MMFAFVIVAVVTIAANAWAVTADLTQPKWLLANMEEVGVPRSWLPPLAAFKGAGAAGLVLGLVGVRPLGIAAAIGLVLFFTGALTAHVRARACTTSRSPAPTSPWPPPPPSSPPTDDARAARARCQSAILTHPEGRVPGQVGHRRL
jgi:hypothetical protein